MAFVIHFIVKGFCPKHQSIIERAFRFLTSDFQVYNFQKISLKL